MISTDIQMLMALLVKIPAGTVATFTQLASREPNPPVFALTCTEITVKLSDGSQESRFPFARPKADGFILTENNVLAIKNAIEYCQRVELGLPTIALEN